MIWAIHFPASPTAQTDGKSGAYQTTSATEDMEVVVRLHRFLKEKKIPCKIRFVPDASCRTVVPETFKSLERQRRRWQRGLVKENLLIHKRMLFKPHYGVVGLFALPYFLIFEALGPLIELAGYITIASSFILGLIGLNFLKLFFLAAILYGGILCTGALLLHGIIFRERPRTGSLIRLLLVGLILNFGYRQLVLWWRALGIWDFLRGKRGWGKTEPAPAVKPGSGGPASLLKTRPVRRLPSNGTRP